MFILVFNFDFFVFRNDVNLFVLFNAKARVVEELSWHYLADHYRSDTSPGVG